MQNEESVDEMAVLLLLLPSTGAELSEHLNREFGYKHASAEVARADGESEAGPGVEMFPCVCMCCHVINARGGGRGSDARRGFV